LISNRISITEIDIEEHLIATKFFFSIPDSASLDCPVDVLTFLPVAIVGKILGEALVPPPN